MDILPLSVVYMYDRIHKVPNSPWTVNNNILDKYQSSPCIYMYIIVC